MYRNTKVATCCYCGTRAALVLGKDRHELVCASCGAPLHQLKSLKTETTSAPRPMPAYSLKPLKKNRKRKSTFKRLLAEVLDEIEDIFD